MKKYLLPLIVIFVFSCICVGCKSFGSQSGSPQIDAGKDIPKDTLIKLQRTRCFGTCPAYELVVYADGKVTFDGTSWDINGKEKKSGFIESKISQEKVKEILREFQKADFFNLGESDEFSHGKCYVMTDMPSAITTIRYNSKEKTMDHYHGCDKAPKALAQLENRIDEIVNTKQWTK